MDQGLEALERRPKRRMRTGCVTCRIRRIKCDEQKPCCRRCISTGRRCDGYTSGPVPQPPSTVPTIPKKSRTAQSSSPVIILPLGPPNSKFASTDEARSFDFFRTCTLPKLTGLFPQDFWSSLVLQRCDSEPAIRHGLLALSAMHERFERTQAVKKGAVYHGAQQEAFAFAQYAKALKHASELLTAAQLRHDHVKSQQMLIACIIFVCYENMAGNYAAAQIHLQSGLHLLPWDWQKKSATENDAVTSSHQTTQTYQITRSLAALDLQATTFSVAEAPYRHDSLDARILQGCPDMPAAFTSLIEARYHLMGTLRCLFRIGPIFATKSTEACSPDVLDSLLVAKSRCEKALKQWSSRFTSFLHTPSPERAKTLTFQSGVVLLQIYHTLAELILHAGFSPVQSTWDAYVPQFMHILTLTSHLLATSSASFSFELGTILPLFVVACRCRDPAIRRRAIGLLNAPNRREGVCESMSAANVASIVVGVEEEGQGEVRCAGDVTEEKRVHVLHKRVLFEKRQLHVTCMLKPEGIDGAWAVKEKVVDF